MRAPLLLLAVLPGLLLAGCVAPETNGAATPESSGSAAALVPPAPTFDWSAVVEADHANHQLPQLHTGGHGLKLKGFASIGDLFPPTVRGSITQVDVWNDLAVVSGMEGGLGFALVNISDPAKPRAVSYFPSAADGWTARFSADGQYVFYGCQMLPAPPYVTTAQVVGDCTDPQAVHAPGSPQSGVVAVDVKDRANPKLVTFLPTGGSHNIFVTSINGTDVVFTSAVTILTFDRAAGKLTEVAKVPGVHDATVHRHPVTGDWLLFTGAAKGSFAIYKVNDPAAPEILYEGGLEGVVGWHEQTLIPGVVGGRVVLAVGGETSQSTTGVIDTVSFVDVTDPAKPVKLSTWKPPFQSAVPWTSYLYSVHEMAATPTGQVAIAWYHAGVWVLDVSTPERQAEPVTLAAYLPNQLPSVAPSTFFQTPVPYVPFVWGIGWEARGHLVVPDMHTGLYLLEPAWGLHPAASGGQ